MIRAAAVLAWFTGLCFGLPCSYAIWYLADRGHIWTFLGFPTYGAGPFKDIGIKTTVPLLILFLLVCVAELAAGWLRRRGASAGALVGRVRLLDRVRAAIGARGGPSPDGAGAPGLVVAEPAPGPASGQAR
jgi:hypothetical protein